MSFVVLNTVMVQLESSSMVVGIYTTRAKAETACKEIALNDPNIYENYVWDPNVKSQIEIVEVSPADKKHTKYNHGQG